MSLPKMVRFSFCKKLLKGRNALFKSTKLANAHGRYLGVLWYISFIMSVMLGFRNILHMRPNLGLVGQLLSFSSLYSVICVNPPFAVVFLKSFVVTLLRVSIRVAFTLSNRITSRFKTSNQAFSRFTSILYGGTCK